mmetsp:Transcript_24670/g.45980  ORF Transcript_24670/g.45980 Transcript_24670/m.45980 type:complete len:229 (-) Transcript_24670:242-928(-)
MHAASSFFWSCQGAIARLNVLFFLCHFEVVSSPPSLQLLYFFSTYGITCTQMIAMTMPTAVSPTQQPYSSTLHSLVILEHQRLSDHLWWALFGWVFWTWPQTSEAAEGEAVVAHPIQVLKNPLTHQAYSFDYNSGVVKEWVVFESGHLHEEKVDVDDSKDLSVLEEPSFYFVCSRNDLMVLAQVGVVIEYYFESSMGLFVAVRPELSSAYLDLVGLPTSPSLKWKKHL